MMSAGMLFVCPQPRQDTLFPQLGHLLADVGASLVFSGKAEGGLLPLEAVLRRIVSDFAPALVLVVGGAGIAPQDCAPDALRAVCLRMVPGIPERIRAALPPSESLFFRGCAGFREKTLLINLPEASAPSALAALLPLLTDF